MDSFVPTTGGGQQHWPTKSTGYKLECPVGQGSFGLVWKALNIDETSVNVGKYVAIKIVDLEHFQDGNLADIRKEINIMSSCLHKNLCRYYVSFMDDSDLWMVMPLLGAGSVVDIIKLRHPNGIKDEAMIATILKETLEGVLYLHNQSQIHRDIKAGNILMDENGEILLCDFGVSAHIKVGQPRTTFVGSPCWMAPEVMEQTDGYDFKADVWSLGITALELACGDAPNSDLPAMRVLLVIINQAPPHLPKNEEWSPEFRHFIDCCLQKDPTRRFNTQDIFKEHKKFFDKAQGPDYVVQKMLKGLEPLEKRVGKALENQAIEYFQKKEKKNLKSKKGTIAWDFSGMDSGEYEQKQKPPQDNVGVRNNHLQANQKIPDNELDDFDLDETDQPMNK